MSEGGCTELCDVCLAPARELCRRCGADVCDDHGGEGRACDRCVRRARVAIVIAASLTWMVVIAAAFVTENGGFVAFAAIGWILLFIAGMTWATARRDRVDPMVPADPDPPSLPSARVIERR